MEREREREREREDATITTSLLGHCDLVDGYTSGFIGSSPFIDKVAFQLCSKGAVCIRPSSVPSRARNLEDEASALAQRYNVVEKPRRHNPPMVKADTFTGARCVKMVKVDRPTVH